MPAVSPSRSLLHRASLGLGLLALAACDAPPLAPRFEADAPLAARAHAPKPRPAGRHRDTAFTVFVINPKKTSTYRIDRMHELVVRAHGVCDLDSPYGPTYWDAPCAPARHPIAVTARTWKDDQGHPRIDFSPELRFVPGDDEHPAAVLRFHDRAAANDTTSTILYCGPWGCIDESLTDPTLVTRRDGPRGSLSRRIKHFSGYEVSVGRYSDDWGGLR
jgi:hypothetical protein